MTICGKAKAGIIGVGVIGSAMAKNLVEAGFDLVGHDIAPEAMALLQKLGGRPMPSSAAVLAEAEVVITSMPSAKALLSVAEELARSPCPGRTVAENSTLTLADKQAAFDKLQAAGITMLDCPLSGSANRAAIRDVLVYASGDRAAYDKCLPVFDGFSRAPFYVGAFGNGSKLKYIANHLVAIHTVAAGEAFALARKAGLDPADVYDAIIGGAGGSRAMEARKEMLVSNEYLPVRTASLDLFKKDLEVIGDFADGVECPVPMFTATLPLYKSAIARGMGHEDMAAISLLLQRMAGMKAPQDPAD
jgi:3-hydroxyisobutyrate dehydrogenase-like beta-hydroxyacid dehydrogenase